MLSKKIVASITFVFGLVGNVSAMVVYENGSVGNVSGGHNPFTQQVVNQNFTLGQNAFVNSFTYNAMTRASTLPVTNVYITFSQSGNTIYSGNHSVANTAIVGSVYGFNLTDYTVNLPGVSLAAGTYTLGLQVSPNQFEQHWSIVQGGPVSSDGFSHYFRLESNGAANVPEPTSIALLGLGMAGAAFARRRRNGARSSASLN